MHNQTNFFARQLSKVRFHLYRSSGLKYIKQKFSWGELYVQFDWIGSNIYFGNFENDETELLQRLVRKDSVIIDVGANIGFYSVMLAKRVGSVFSFEPSTREHELLCKNLTLNGLSNVKVFKQALGSRTGAEKLFINDANHGANSFVDSPSNEGSFEEVEVITLDDVMATESPSQIDLIKIDVEGWEHEVLKGSKKIIEKFRPVIFFESWKSFKKPYSSDISEEIDFLTSMNYCLTSYHNDGVHLLKPGDEILTKDLLAVPVENKSLF
jgi:FkbM family methyltransferase